MSFLVYKGAIIFWDIQEPIQQTVLLWLAILLALFPLLLQVYFHYRSNPKPTQADVDADITLRKSFGLDHTVSGQE